MKLTNDLVEGTPLAGDIPLEIYEIMQLAVELELPDTRAAERRIAKLLMLLYGHAATAVTPSVTLHGNNAVLAIIGTREAIQALFRQPLS